tara:strand:+ start:9912 stop:10226 length:315 start_codon:yes stop_codon:yes gene_type:complete
MDETIELNFESWSIKAQERTRDRMKLQIKLSKEEASAFKNFMDMVKPPEIDPETFMKGIFKLGVETMEMKLMEAVKTHAEENDMELSSVGLSDKPTVSKIPTPE